MTGVTDEVDDLLARLTGTVDDLVVGLPDDDLALVWVGRDTNLLAN